MSWTGASPAGNAMELPIFETVRNGLTVRGSIVGTHHHLEQVALHRRGLAKVFHARSRSTTSTRRSSRCSTAARRARGSSSTSPAAAWPTRRRHPEMLGLVTSGRLAPERLVMSRIALDEAPGALAAMTGAARPAGITVIRP
jgi:Zn-dependent alcohol dehydrogenase